MLKSWHVQASASVLDCDLVIMPVHLSVHWTCAAINLRDRELLYLDSMGVRSCYTCSVTALPAPSLLQGNAIQPRLAGPGMTFELNQRI